MNRRPSKSRSEYDAFSAERVRHFFASSPDSRFFEERRRHSPLFFVLVVLLFLLALTILSNLLINQFVFIRRTNVPVTGLAESLDGFSILHISDLKGARFGKDQRILRSALAKESFDVVLITGDMLSDLGNAEPFYELLDVLHELQPDVPVYFIAGDSDPEPASMAYAPGGSPFAPWVLGARQRQATLLNSPQYIEEEDQKIWFLSLTQATLDVNQLRWQYEEKLYAARASEDENAIELAEFQLQSINDTAQMRASLTEKDVTIVLTHAPNTEVLNITSGAKSYPIHLILFGHFLGGLTRLPWIGPVFVPTETLPRYGLFPGKQFMDRPTQIGKTRFIPSRGLGSTDSNYPFFFMRLFNPPTVDLITLSTSSI